MMISVFTSISTLLLIMNSEFYEQMARTYGSIYMWPQPYVYMTWHQSLSAQYQAYYMSPEVYTQNYEFSIKKHNESHKPPKLSRNQKRAQKKKKMQEQLQQERRAIGKWVQLQRKDLIQGLQKIELQQKKIKDKKREKFSHLIEIHKEVYKHHLKIGAKITPSKRVNQSNKKKRMSYIKKMKEVYEKNMNGKKIENCEEKEWESEEQGQQVGETKVQDKKEVKQSVKVELKMQDIEKIKYMEMGKLTGRQHQNIILREWVRNVPNEQLEDITLRLINRLAYKQAIRKVQRPTKAKKLIVSGIKQCKRTTETIIDKNRSKMLIVALNIERNPLKKGVDDEVQNTIKKAQEINIPIVHTSTRSKLGRAFTGKFGPRITMVSIINFQGYQDMMEQLMTQWKQACHKYSLL